MNGSSKNSPAIQLICAPETPSLLPEGSPHILLAIDQLARTLGGGERIVLRLAESLPKLGFRVSILTLSLDPASPALHGPPPCRIYLLPLEKTYDLTALRAAFALRRFLQEEKVNLVQTFFESSDLWIGAITKTVPGIALIWSRRDLGILRERKHRIAYRLLARMPDMVFAVSEQVRQHALKVDRIPAERVVTVYNGIEVPATLPTRSLDPHAIHVTAIGNLRHVKGFDVLLDAAALVIEKHSDTRFTIAGMVLDPSYAERLSAQCVALKIGSNVTFVGNVTDVSEHLLSADIFVLPSRSEGFSNAILEAMAMGVPVIATDVGGNAEAVEDQRSGLIVPPEDTGALAAAICILIEDSETRKRLGEEGCERVKHMFSFARMMEVTSRNYFLSLKSVGNEPK